mgnify:CR=1 FL=1
MKFILLFLLPFFSLYAKDYKLELGLGIASLYYPNYIGSKSTQVLTLPIPYLRYTGKYFKIDEDGLSGKLFGINGLRLDLSVSGSLPANSDSVGVRQGMPDLDLTGEIGFKLVYNLFEQGVSKLELELPLRAVLSTDFSNLKYRGVITNPQLRYSLNYSEFEWTFKTAAYFANKDYHSYYYEVKDKYVTPSRAAYEASGGFSGYRGRVGMTYKKESWWFGAFVSYFDIKNAVYKDSPLVETHSAIYSGVSLAYIFYTK